MKYYYTLLLICASFFLLKSNDENATKDTVFSTVKEDAIRIAIPTWDELKNREYDLKEFGLLSNEKSTLFIKVFMAKIKYIKRHVNDDGFIAKNNIPLNPQTKKIDEKQMLENIKQEVLLLLGFSASDIFDPNGKTNQFFTK
jgi:hypothetical protein